MQISRRALLSVLPATTLPKAARPQRATAADRVTERPARPAADRVAEPAVRPASAADQAAVLANTLAVFAGTPASNAHPETAAKLAAIEAAGATRLAAMDGAGAGELFRGLALGSSDAHLATSFQYLYEIALATRTPGPASSALRGDTAVRRRVADGLARLYDTYYGDQAKGYYGNWFTWEIGISSAVSRTLVLLRDVLAAHRPGLTAAYVAAMDGYLRNGKDGDVDLDSRFHTGANLADITTDRVLQGAVLGDDARITKAVADQLTVCAPIDPHRLRHGVTDGFYADGSFVQHGSVAYTGSYGTGLLTRVVQTLKILHGTSYTPGGELAGTLRGWIADSFAPVLFEGWMMEAVKGRAVSRPGTGYADAAAVVEAAVDLSAYTSGADAAALAGYVKHLRRTTRAAPDPAAFVSPVSIARYADILADPDVPARDLNPAAHHAAFPAMDRSIHRRPGHAFALARSSTRISGYEYMGGENLTPWFQGAGAHHLYLSGQDQTQAFGIDHLTALPPDRLPGATAPEEERRTVPELYGTQWYDNPALGFTSSSESQNAYVYLPRGTNAYSGGAVLGAYGIAGLVLAPDAAFTAKQAGLLPDDFTAYRGADGTRSWFMLDDEIVVLAAGVGDAAGRAVTTTLDARIAAPGAPVALTGRLRDGAPWSGTGTGPLAWLRYADAEQGTAIGYVFLDAGNGNGGADGAPQSGDGLNGATSPDHDRNRDRNSDRDRNPDRARSPEHPLPTVALDTLIRSRRLVRAANPDTPVTKQVFTLTVRRPPGAAPAALAYALVPHATERRLRRYTGGPLSVLANTTALQALRHRESGITAANAFAPGIHRVRHLSLDGPASVILRERPDGGVQLAVADPTTARDTVEVVLHGRPLRAVSADDGVRVRRIPGGTRVSVTTRHSYGRSMSATLR